MLLIPCFSVIRSDIGRRHANVIRRAMVHAYGSIQAGCMEIETSQANFNHALDGERGLPPGFLEMSPAFLGWYGVGLLQEFGIPEEIKVAGRALFGLMAKKRMARIAHGRIA